MDPANSDGAWREIHIVPRYNAAGVKKFAFHFAAGMPLIGKPPRWKASRNILPATSAAANTRWIGSPAKCARSE